MSFYVIVQYICLYDKYILRSSKIKYIHSNDGILTWWMHSEIVTSAHAHSFGGAAQDKEEKKPRHFHPRHKAATHAKYNNVEG